MPYDAYGNCVTQMHTLFFPVWVICCESNKVTHVPTPTSHLKLQHQIQEVVNATYFSQQSSGDYARVLSRKLL